MSCVDGHAAHLAPMGGGPCVRCGKPPPAAKENERPATLEQPTSGKPFRGKPVDPERYDFRKKASGDE